MLARRNLNFWTAALLASAAYLTLTARDSLEAVHRLELPDTSFGFDLAIVVYAVAHLVAFAGWVIVATSFRLRIDWRRLRLGGAITASAYVAIYAASAIDVVELPDGPSSIHAAFVWASIGNFLTGIAAFVVVSGLGYSKRGAARGLRLQFGLLAGSGSIAALGVSAFELRAYYVSTTGFSPGLQTAALVTAIGQVVLALAVAFFAFESRSLLEQREAMLTVAATAATVAAIGIAVGHGLTAYDYGIHDAPGWRLFVYWLEVAFPSAFALGLAFVALGARAAVTEVADA